MTNATNYFVTEAQISKRIVAIAAASVSLFVELGAVSRDLLTYVPQSNDIGAVNRLLDVLNRTDRQHAVLFFSEFLPWKFNDITKHFGAKLGGERRLADMATERETFLKTMITTDDGKEHEATIWDWVEVNVNVAERKVDYNKNIVNLITRATAPLNADGTENKFQITTAQVLTDVMNAGVTIDDLMAVVDKAMAERKAAELAAKKLADAAAKKAAKAANANNKAKPAKQMTMNG